MKKQFFALTILASILPLAANAEPPKMSQKVIQETANQYGAIYCTEGLNALKEAVQKCYKNTPDTSSAIDKCLITDRALTNIAVRKNMNYEAAHGSLRNDPNASDPYYSLETHGTREKYYLSSPRFKKDPIFKKLSGYDVYSYLPNPMQLANIFTEKCPDPSIKLQ